MAETKNMFHGRVLIVAFEGWNDAADAATGAAKTLIDQLPVHKIFEVDPEHYFDYQFTRPVIRNKDGERRLEWPTVALYGPEQHALEHLQKNSTVKPYDELSTVDNSGNTITLGSYEDVSKVYILLGQEPARSWKTFSKQVIDKALELDIDLVIFLGSMLSDVPHSRPINIFSISQNESIRLEYDAEHSNYEGPVGALSALAERAEDCGIPTLMFWASIPHYVHNMPSPKAVLALIESVQQILPVTFFWGSLLKETQEWEENINALAADDADMAAYIQQLEHTRDTVSAPEATGEMIAQEFERYLRRRDDSQGGQPGGPDESHRG